MTFAKFRFIPQYHSASPDFYYLYEITLIAKLDYYRAEIQI